MVWIRFLDAGNFVDPNSEMGESIWSRIQHSFFYLDVKYGDLRVLSYF